jgi:hypothetical protein
MILRRASLFLLFIRRDVMIVLDEWLDGAQANEQCVQ